jgi:hypothetical protein
MASTVAREREGRENGGQIWVDESTFRIRRIEGIPAKSPSFWLKDIHITLQFAQLDGKWVATSFDAIAAVRLLGQYTLAGHNIRAPEPRKKEKKYDSDSASAGRTWRNVQTRVEYGTRRSAV